MGCFGGSKQPQYNPPTPPRLPTADELYNTGIAKTKEVSPLAYGAREGALADLSSGNAFYEQFQPSSFDQALSNQYFQNVYPDIEEVIKSNLSRAGVAYSPILAQQLGKARGELGFNIGSFLSNQGNERARYSLDRRLSMNPFNDINPIVGVGQDQSNTQAEMDYNYAVQKAQADYQNALDSYKQGQARNSLFSTLGGAAIGALTGGLAAPAMSMLGGPFAGMSAWIPGALKGAAVGGVAGGTLSPLFGGGQLPINIQDVMSVYQATRQPKRGSWRDPYSMSYGGY